MFHVLTLLWVFICFIPIYQPQAHMAENTALARRKGEGTQNVSTSIKHPEPCWPILVTWHSWICGLAKVMWWSNGWRHLRPTSVVYSLEWNGFCSGRREIQRGICIWQNEQNIHDRCADDPRMQSQHGSCNQHLIFVLKHLSLTLLCGL